MWDVKWKINWTFVSTARGPSSHRDRLHLVSLTALIEKLHKMSWGFNWTQVRSLASPGHQAASFESWGQSDGFVSTGMLLCQSSQQWNDHFLCCPAASNSALIGQNIYKNQYWNTIVFWCPAPDNNKYSLLSDGRNIVSLLLLGISQFVIPSSSPASIEISGHCANRRKGADWWSEYLEPAASLIIHFLCGRIIYVAEYWMAQQLLV